jgi:hypothetical protein
VPPNGPVQRVDQLPGSAAEAATVVSINAAEAATIIAFIAVLHSFKGVARSASATTIKVASAICPRFAGV